MRKTSYRGDVDAYIERLQFLNEKAGLTRTSLLDVIRDELSAKIIRMLLMCEHMNFDFSI